MSRQAFIGDKDHSFVQQAFIFDAKAVDRLGLWGETHHVLKRHGLSCSIRKIITPTVFDLTSGQWIEDLSKPKVCVVRSL